MMNAGLTAGVTTPFKPISGDYVVFPTGQDSRAYWQASPSALPSAIATITSNRDFILVGTMPIVFDHIQATPGSPPSRDERLNRPEAEPLVGTHLREAIAIVKDWVKHP